MLASLEPILIVAIFLSIAVLALLGWVIRLERKLRRLCRGRQGENLEGIICDIQEGQKGLEDFRLEVEGYLTNVERRLRRSIQGVEAMRFNPFKGSGAGGNQSFSVAFLNEEGNGIVMSGLYTRESTRVYGKPLTAHASEYELTEEERNVIERARQKLKVPHPKAT